MPTRPVRTITTKPIPIPIPIPWHENYLYLFIHTEKPKQLAAEQFTYIFL